ncbi:hypothetical protein BRD03_00535 [Halobacteriales archaeon QS_9_68_17]|nr:MAG: hypothetical protein BRD03_00535 [Halobacteriales archaeon QS_9_68_17]
MQTGIDETSLTVRVEYDVGSEITDGTSRTEEWQWDGCRDDAVAVTIRDPHVTVENACRRD